MTLVWAMRARPRLAEAGAGGFDCGTSGAADCGNRRESEERVSSALNQNSNGIATAGMTGPVYVTEPPLSPPAPRASAQAPMPTPPQPERPALEVAPAPAPLPPAEPEAPLDLPLEGLLLRFGLLTTEQLTEAMRERSATGKDIGAIVVERGWVDAAQLARIVSGDTAPEPEAAAAPEPTPEPEAAPEPEPAPPPPAATATRSTGQRVKVCVRLTSGERVEAGSFTSLEEAKERGAEIARTLAADAPEWPFVAGRFLRPDTIVSLDVEPELSA
jgi:hypothetical protein